MSIDDAKCQEGGRAYRGTGEGDFLPILADDERANRILDIQHGPRFEDIQIVTASIFDDGDDLQVGRRRDLGGWGREVDLKTARGASRGRSVSTDGRETKSSEREREHGDAKKSKDDWIEGRGVSALNPPPLYIFRDTRLCCGIANALGAQYEAVDG